MIGEQQVVGKKQKVESGRRARDKWKAKHDFKSVTDEADDREATKDEQRVYWGGKIGMENVDGEGKKCGREEPSKWENLEATEDFSRRDILLNQCAEALQMTGSLFGMLGNMTRLL